MDIKEIQRFLKLPDDGIAGNQTIKSIKNYFNIAYPKIDISKWNKNRLLVGMEQAIYAENKLPIISVDGLIGEQTRHVREIWNSKSIGDTTKTEEERCC
jgi:hypothetical protein